MTLKSTTLAAALGLALVIPSQAGAAPIVGLFNTGTDANNVALVGGDGVTDPHYSAHFILVSGQAVTYRNPAWLANDADSRWISMTSTGASGNNTIAYRLFFDLTGLDPATANITGSWAVDNLGSILINGFTTNNFIGNPGNFGSLTPFAITSGFVAGINSLDFVVTNQGGPGGLRVDNIAGTAGVPTSGVPEPATWAMMLAGFGLAGASLRSRKPRSRRQAVRIGFA